MGVVFGIIFLAVLFLTGLSGIVAGVVGLIIMGVRKRADRPFPRFLTVIFAVILAGGVLTAIIPVVCFGVLVLMNNTPPDDFVETEIVIEEDGYQDTRFTADGVVYEVLDLQLYDTEAACNPIFTYKTQGLLNGSQCGNYYDIENSQGFNLVSDARGALFSPVDERERIIEYYTNPQNLCGYYDDFDGGEFKLTDGENDIIKGLMTTDLTALPKEEIISDCAVEFSIIVSCNERLIYMESYWFLALDGEIYYVESSTLADNGGFEYTLIELPEEIRGALYEIHKESNSRKEQ